MSPYVAREDKNVYMREYMKRRYHERRAWALKELGGKCCNCSTTENLEFHHKNPVEKEAAISKIWNKAYAVFEAEVRKCELLCKQCHIVVHRATEHGTLAMYRHCKCDACREAHNAYCKEWKRKKRASVIQSGE
ncbi:hypothetical protein DRO27_05925 [Candidatus Bathyarchaeota archaeon]|nr:MAG: hypothetical protein DRO27_05925 [Candidatus Bathyarchaeota archaeon]